MISDVRKQLIESYQRELYQLENEVWLEIAPIYINNFHLYKNEIKNTDVTVQIDLHPMKIKIHGATVQNTPMRFERNVSLQKEHLNVLSEIYKELSARYMTLHPGAILLIRVREVKHA